MGRKVWPIRIMRRARVRLGGHDRNVRPTIRTLIQVRKAIGEAGGRYGGQRTKVKSWGGGAYFSQPFGKRKFELGKGYLRFRPLPTKGNLGARSFLGGAEREFEHASLDWLVE